MLQNSLRGEPKYHPGNIFHRKNCYIPFILMINIYIYIYIVNRGLFNVDKYDNRARTAHPSGTPEFTPVF